MRLLVLGGTAWLGALVAADAVRRGHQVTCLARGSAGKAPTGTRFVAADRDQPDAYDVVGAEPWDAVVDVARQPGHVRRAVAALEPVAERYLFVSSANAYADQRTPGADEDAPLLPPLESDVMESMERYGEAKVACEQAVLGGFGPSRTLVARAGLLGGPGDWSGRSGYWPWRFSSLSNPAGAVLVPAIPDRLTSVLDARDLAGWLVTCAEAGTAGVYNAAGPVIGFGDHVGVVREVTGHAGPVVEAGEEWLRERGVGPWMGPRTLPLWLDDPDWYGMNARRNDRAVAAGLTVRPLADTLRHVLAWELGRPDPGPHGAGLTDAEERALLAELGQGG